MSKKDRAPKRAALATTATLRRTCMPCVFCRLRLGLQFAQQPLSAFCVDEQGWLDTTDTITFESSLNEVSAVGSPAPSTAKKKAEYNEMARALYRAMAEHPGESAAECAELAAEALKPLRISPHPTSITRRTGKIDQALLASLQAKLQAEKAETSPKN